MSDVWNHYWRDEKKRNSEYRNLGHRRYSEKRLPEKKKLAVYAEDGIGEQIFSFQYAESVAEENDVLWLVDHRLIPIFDRTIPKNTKLADIADAIPADRELIYSKELWGMYKDVYKFKPTFLKPQADLLKKLQAKFSDKNIVGIAWKSDREGVQVTEKCCPFEEEGWKDIFQVEDLCFLNLQYKDVKDDIIFVRDKYGVDIHTENDVDIFNDIDGSSALIDACDFIISISTTVAHLAGALGKPGSLLLNKKHMFHWNTDAYPSLVKLIQDNKGDWSMPLSLTKNNLAEFLEK